MKKWIALIVVLAMCLSFAGCGSSETQDPANTDEVVSSATPENDENTAAPGEETDAPETEAPDESEEPNDPENSDAPETEAPDESEEPGSTEEPDASKDADDPATQPPAETQGPVADNNNYKNPAKKASIILAAITGMHPADRATKLFYADWKGNANHLYLEYTYTEASWDADYIGSIGLKWHVTLGNRFTFTPGMMATALADLMMAASGYDDVGVEINRLIWSQNDGHEDEDTGEWVINNSWHMEIPINANGTAGTAVLTKNGAASTADVFKADGKPASWQDLYQLHNDQGPGVCGGDFTLRVTVTAKSTGDSITTRSYEGPIMDYLMFDNDIHFVIWRNPVDVMLWDVYEETNTNNSGDFIR